MDKENKLVIRVPRLWFWVFYFLLVSSLIGIFYILKYPTNTLTLKFMLEYKGILVFPFLLLTIIILIHIHIYKLKLDQSKFSKKQAFKPYFEEIQLENIRSAEIARVKYFYDNLTKFDDPVLNKVINSYKKSYNLRNLFLKKPFSDHSFNNLPGTYRILFYIKTKDPKKADSIVFDISPYSKKSVKRLIQKFRDLNINVVIEPGLKLD